MKKTWQCPKCGSQRVGYLEQASDQSDQANKGRMVGWAPTATVFGLAAYMREGEIEAFVCTECGYFEEYVKTPQAVRWDELRGFRWCRPPQGR